MVNGLKLRNGLLLVALGFAAALPHAHAEAWRIGVISDTQYTKAADAVNINSVAVKQIEAINQKFVEAGVKFVFQVGDLADNSSAAGLATRLDANWALDAAGIPFYAVRGNHDNSSAKVTYFRDNFVPSSTDDATVSVAADGMTYSVLYNGFKLVMLDYSITGSTSVMPTLTNWMRDELALADHTHAFVVSHKNLAGQNHKDNLFGSNNDANPALQNDFIGALQEAGVRYYVSGHDHVHHRARVESPDGLSSVQQIIAQSNSSKWYTPKAPYTARETPFAQELNKIGHYIYTVDGPRLSGQYFATAPVNYDIADDPEWALQEVFGYSLNGAAKVVAQGESFAMTHVIPAGTHFGESGYVGTSMSILDGVNNSGVTVYGGRPAAKDVNIGWAPKAMAGSDAIVSDVLTVWGMHHGVGSDQGDPYVLQLSHKGGTRGAFALVGRDTDGEWMHADERNFEGTAKFIIGPWKAGYAVGTYGVDPAAQTAWAVVDRGGEFAVSKSFDGDLNGDATIDSRDIALVTQKLNQAATTLPGADFDGDGRITALDTRKLALICSLPNCAIAQ